MNFNYGNNNYNFFNNYNTNNIINQTKSNINIPKNPGINNYNNYPMDIFFQYFNNLNSNPLNIKQPNINNFNNNNINILNSANIFQLMPNIIKFGFNQPYSFENTKKEPKIIHPSNFKSKLNYINKNPISTNNHYDNNEDDSNERKFMRKMTKAEKIEIDKWFEARKKLYPTKKNIELKKQMGEIKVERGLVSELELKLRKKVNILKKLNSSKRIKFQNHFNKNFMSFQQRKKELLESKKNSNDKISKNNNLSNINNDINNEQKENTIEEGEIVEEIKSNNNEKNNENKKNFIGKKRERKVPNIKKKLGKSNKQINNENKKENGFKKGFKYKINNLYDELIKKDKIKEQNILLQAIRYLINVKDE